MNITQRPMRFFKNFFGYFVVFVLIVLSFIGGLVAGQNRSGKPIFLASSDKAGQVTGVGQTPDYITKDVDASLLWDAWKTVKEKYVDQPVDEHKLLYGAITGLVDSMNDPHSNYFTPDVNNNFLQELSGTFFGIGAEIALKNNQLQVVAPLSDSPAEKAGLRSGDFILKIDGVDTTNMFLDEAVNKIRGPKGTIVTLTIYRNGDKKSRELEVTRDEIKIESVSWAMDKGPSTGLGAGNVANIKLKYFNEDTGVAFRKVATEIAAKKPSYIILDMRNNPGGILDVAVDIASQFVEDSVIVSERSSTGEITSHKSFGTARLKGYKVIVLLNEGSASASEILAGALKDYGIATIIGMKSYGKGSVQTLFDLKDGSAIKLTIAKWLTPKGNTIEGVGISPDIQVDLTEDDFNKDLDPQLDKAKSFIADQLKP